MSCGNRFVCGIRRFDKHKFEPNHPSNQELHTENESRLSELLRAREQQDQAFFPVQTSTTVATTAVAIATPSVSTPTVQSTYTPWTYRDDSRGAPLGGS